MKVCLFWGLFPSNFFKILNFERSYTEKLLSLSEISVSIYLEFITLLKKF